MRSTIIAIGSRGDVQPCVALAVGMQAAGHHATVATHERYRSLVTAAGVHFAPVAEGRLSQGGATEEGARWADAGSKRLPGWVGFYEDAKSVAHQRLVDGIEATRDADVVVAPGLSTVLGLQMANLFGIPLIRAHYSPAGWADTTLGRHLVWQWARPFINKARRREGMASLPLGEPFTDLDRRGVPLLDAFSPLVAPDPDRGDWVTATGWWVLDEQRHEPLAPELEAFLAAGPPPVLIGFGAMIDDDMEATLEIVVDALGRAGQRGVFLHERFDAASHRLPDTVFGGTYAPHAALFPHLAAMVHHGGAGTTGAALRAGLPAVVVPFFADQPAWGQRVAELGVGPEPIPRKQLTAENLGDAIRRAATDDDIRRRARELADRLADEDGVGAAVAIIERHVEQSARREDDDPIVTRACPVCPLCGSEGDIAYHDTRDAIYGLPGLWTYRRCRADRCGALWLDPVPHEEEMGSLYDRPYYTTSGVEAPRAENLEGPVAKVRAAYLEEQFGYDLDSDMGRAGRAFTWGLVRVVPGGRDYLDDTASFVPAPDGPARFLEVGFGSGGQLDHMRELGWDVTGLDPDPTAVKAATDRGLDARLGTLEDQDLGDGEFDAVYISHVIEHVHDPMKMLVESHRVLRPGGHLVVLTPNARSRCHERYRSAWFSLQPPFHLVLFTPEALGAAFVRAGFEVTRSRTSSRRAFIHDVGSLDIRATNGTNGLPSFDGRIPVSRLFRGLGAQYAESARIALGRDAGEELVFVGRKR